MTEPLTITTSPREDHQLDMTILVGPERTEQALQKAAKQVSKRANVPGFRRGHAPYAAVLRAFGREALLNEVIDELGQEVYSEALEQEKIEPFAQAALVDVATDPLTFKLTVPLEPTVDLGDYRSIHIDRPEVNVTEADVDAVIEQRRDQAATWVDIERPAAIGDMVVVDIKGTVGEETIMDNHDWELTLKEESGWLPGFDQAFVGLASGDQKTFALTYPEDSTSRYKGQEATFEATVKTVRARMSPELTDEWAKEQGEYQDLADLRAKLLERLTTQRRAEAESKLSDDAIQALIDRAVVMDYPPVIVDESVDEMVHDLEHRLSQIGYKLDDYLKLQGTNQVEYRQQIRPQAEQRAKGRLVLSALAKEENIEVSPEEISARTAQITPEDSSQTANLRELLTSERGRDIISQDLTTEKTLARLRAIVTGEAEQAPAAGTSAAAEPTEDQAAAEMAVEAAAPAAEDPEPAAAGDQANQAKPEEGEPTVEAESET